MLTLEYLNSLFRYDFPLGKLFWLVAKSHNVRVGDEAGCINSDGYRYVRIDGKRYLTHRLIWQMCTGLALLPDEVIDHRNHVVDDNRIDNLRVVSRSVNMQNQIRARSNNKSSFLGVSKWGDKWKAQIKLDGKSIHLGYFNTAEAAHEAYLATKRRLHPGNML